MNKNLVLKAMQILYNKKTLDEVPAFDHHFANHIKANLSLKSRKSTYKALEWAKENEEFDYKNLMEELLWRTLVFSNEEIYSFLMNFKSFMENKEFGLLTDDKPPHEF